MPNAISLFCGCGGCSLGLTRANFDIVLAADVNDDACKTYSNNVSKRVWALDLTTTSPDQIQTLSGTSRPVDLIAGGPPCQGFSSAGVRNWDDPRNSLLRRFVELVEAIRPTWFVMENVEGLLTAKEGFYFTETVYRLLSAGYWVKARKLYMEQYGLPQRRKRVVVIGNLDEVEFDFPHPTHVDARQPSMLGRPGLSVLDAIGDLPSPSASGGIAYGVTDAVTDFQRAMRRDDGLPVSLHKAIAVNQVTQARINGLKQGQSMKDLPEDLQHPSFQRRAFRRVMDGTPTEKRGGAPAGLKRLVAAEPSLTITTSAMREFVHPLQDRLLTLREMARIQSFPDRFEFSGTPTSVATQIGNAVPPLFMELLARHMAASARWKPLSESGRWLGISVSESSMMSPALARMLEALEERTNGFR